LTTETIPQTVLFADLFDRPLVATFDQQHASSDGGAVLLKAAERRYDLIDRFARCLVDERQPGKVRHPLADLLAQRLYGLACGHPDANDAERLANDPIHKLLLGRDPVAGEPLASQPTISRFENGHGTQALYEMGRELAACVIERHRRRLHGRARLITIDLDPTDDPTHGAQQLTFFNGHYDCWCYLPLLAFLTFDDETEQYLCAAMLRPGNAPATRGARGLLRRLIDMLRLAFPKARFLVRLDGGFATPEIFDVLDAEPRLDYVVAMAENPVLARHAESAMVEARSVSERSGQTEHVYTEAHYAARTWPHERRVVIKAEVVRLPGREPRDNPRFVITNLRQTPRWIYEHVYCARGDIENRIKELHDGLQIGRTSCCRFWANQLRVFLTAAAYVLMQELRLRAARTACARTQVSGLRERLLKLGVHVVVSVRRIVLHLPTSTPDLTAWRHIALALGARTG
jgi:Transposase DDE domain group 1